MGERRNASPEWGICYPPVGFGYQDDQDAARDTIPDAARTVDGVLDDPAVQVYLLELGASSVNFEIRYWTLADIGSVRSVQDRLISAVKRSLDENGFDIPWPIRTLKLDMPIEFRSATAPADGSNG